MARLLDQLHTFVRGKIGDRHRWGQNDCGLFLADWAMIRWGVEDPAADLRGQYGWYGDAAVLLKPTGGYLRTVDRMSRSIGLRRTQSPELGDIAILRDPNNVPIGAIRANNGWFFLPRSGLGFVQTARLVKAWGE